MSRMPLSSAVVPSAMTSLRHDEKTPEWEQRAAIRAARVGACDELRIGGLECASLRLLERIEQRLEPRALGPLLDRVLAFEHLEVLALPYIEGRRERSQDAVVEGWVFHRGRPEERLELRPPRPAQRRFRNRRVG